MAYQFNPFTGTLDIVGAGGSVSIGDAIGGADPDRILFADVTGNLAQDIDFLFDSVGRTLNIGAGTFGIISFFGGSITQFDGTDVIFYSGVEAGKFTFNPSFSTGTLFEIRGRGASDPPLMWGYPSGDTITFGDDLDFGGTIGISSIATGDTALIIRGITSQTGRLTSWQANGLNQLLGVNISGELEFGSTSQGVKASGATTGILTLTGYGNSNNESLSLNFESVANTVGVTSSTGVTALTFSGFSLSASSFTGSMIMTDNVGLSMGSGTDARLEFDTTEGNDTLKLGLVCNSANSSGNFIICESADINTDFGASQVINPTLRIQSADATSTADFIAFHHDQTDATVTWGTGLLQFTDPGSTKPLRLGSNTIGFYGVTPVAQSAAYSVSNVTTDRTYDANSYTTDELADVLGTLIADLKLTGIIG